MSKIDKDVTKIAFEGLDVILQLVRLGGEKGEHAATIFELIGTIVESILAGKDRKIDPADVAKTIQDGLDAFDKRLEADKKTAMDILDQRFPPVAQVVKGGVVEHVELEASGEETLPSDVQTTGDVVSPADVITKPVETIDDKFTPGE